ncbi:MAG: TetR/AcrR family transcriptional regulator [Clostridia bacterium]|nr:TetR/AcrR family transcriptional regulator [Clostridia bacterium]
MYTLQKNPTAIRSQTMLSEALVRLMEKYPFQKITITQLCQEADVGRKTFYRNFEFIEDVLTYQMDSLYEEYSKFIFPNSNVGKLKAHYEFILHHHKYINLLMKNDLITMFMERFYNFRISLVATISDSPIEQEYYANSLLATISAISMTWAKRNFQETVDEITEITIRALTKADLSKLSFKLK